MVSGINKKSNEMNIFLQSSDQSRVKTVDVEWTELEMSSLPCGDADLL